VAKIVPKFQIQHSIIVIITSKTQFWNHPWHVTLDLFEKTSLIVTKLKTMQQYLIILRFFEEKPCVSDDLL
jgi:hypothetical protein